MSVWLISLGESLICTDLKREAPHACEIRDMAMRQQWWFRGSCVKSWSLDL